ncbi:unnamed protein product [Oikopleura dioica]|uniref:Uncharacterized protein n=1 Tax=Oikopleura dioica TaxID=34765 RepID=E4WXF2_OIKDI|nr:unnamed protein product [Oikopleura dioica]
MMIANEKLRLKIDHLTPGVGAMYIFFGMDKAVGDLPKRNWWCYNTKEYDFDKTVDEFMDLETTDFLAMVQSHLNLFLRRISQKN